MNDTPEAFPLCWPAGRPRTPVYKINPSRFKCTHGEAVKQLVEQVRLIRGDGLVVSTNIAIKRDGMPYANQKQPTDAGVAVYFRRKARQVCLACDKWRTVHENIWAIAKTLDAIRGIERWGSGEMVDAAFTGFEALPPPKSGAKLTERWWWEVLQCEPHWSVVAVETQWKRLARENHTDQGGSLEKMQEINAAYDEFKKERGL